MKERENTFGSKLEYPNIHIKNEAHLSISGNSVNGNPEDSFNPLIDWVGAFKGDTLKIEINLNFISCRSAKLLLKVLITADNNEGVKDKSITWYFKDFEDKRLGDMIALDLKNFKIKFFCLG